MAHNLHDKNGLYIVGLDGHMGLHVIVPPEMCFFLELTAVHPFAMGSNFHPTVQFNGGTPSVTDQHVSKFLWPHLPFEPDPLNLFFPLDVVGGTQKTWLPRLQVLINGTPAAPTVFPGMLSINTNCWMFGQLPTNLVIQPGTVQTTPSPADYEYGAIRWAVDLSISVLLFFASGGMKAGGVEDLDETITNKMADQLFKSPTSSPNAAYSFATAATGFDPGQAVASAVVGQGPSSSVSFSAAHTDAALGKVSPIDGSMYSAQNVGH
jgi:hypothetical protein